MMFTNWSNPALISARFPSPRLVSRLNLHTEESAGGASGGDGERLYGAVAGHGGEAGVHPVGGGESVIALEGVVAAGHSDERNDDIGSAHGGSGIEEGRAAG